jgi:thiol-disulfide isomerase/thioredoxin
MAIMVLGLHPTFAQQIDKQAYVKNYNGIMRAKNAAEAERLFQQLTRDFNEYYNALPDLNRDMPITAVAYAFIAEKDTVKANQYIAMLLDLETRASHLYGMSRRAQEANLEVYREGLLKKTVDAYESIPLKPDPKADPLGLANNREKYGVLFYCEYAQILAKNKKIKEGLAAAKKAYQINRQDKLAVSTYAKLLSDNQLYAQALPVMEAGIISGAADSALLARHKQAYLAVKGKKGYQGQIAMLEAQQQKNVLSEVKKLMLSEVAPAFNLKDLYGKTWSLSELRGKTIILDFWATWCAPCKKSFPAMQMAVNKYKDNKEVVFLFIHTWERDQNATENAAKYVKDNKYSFNVLMDLKKNGRNEAITDYKAEGIPAKFVIDGKGNIRFKLTGFSGTNEAAVAELSTMIELAKSST